MITLRLTIALLLGQFAVAGVLPLKHQIAESRLAVITSPSSSIREITLTELRWLYLGRTTRWPDGERIVLLVRPETSFEQGVFLKRVVEMADIDYAQHWIGEVFRGRAASPPIVARSTAEAKQVVAEDPHAIAYIRASDADASVRVVRIDGKLPQDPGYPLAE